MSTATDCLCRNSVCRGHKRFQRKYLTPRVKLYIRAFVVFVLTIVNVVLAVKDFTAGKEEANPIAMTVTTCVLVSCLSLLFKVGYKSLAVKVREFEFARNGKVYAYIEHSLNPTISAFYTSNENFANGIGKEIAQERGQLETDFLTSANNGNSQNNINVGAGSVSASASSLTTIDGIAPSQGNEEDLSYTIVKRSEDADNSHPANDCFFRRYPLAIVPFFTLGFFAAISVAIYYLVLGIKKGVAPTMSTLQDTYYMAFILYMVCGKWCVMIVLLMRKLQKEGREYLSGDLLRIEKEEVEAENVVIAQENEDERVALLSSSDSTDSPYQAA